MRQPLVVFSSWNGRYSDNPRAIAEEMNRRGAPVAAVWLLGADAGPLPDHVAGVEAESDEALALLERADYIVSNDVLAHPFVKSPATTYLQTWHGTPLKRIAHDVERPRFPKAAEYEVWLPRDVARWDLLLSPNRFSTRVLPTAFRYRGRVLETGYPRNDVLVGPERDVIRRRARAALQIPEGARVVLYAPTWRDTEPFELALDLDELRGRLDDRYVVLVRAHWLVAHTANLTGLRGARDVSAVQDLRELLLAADVLVTDYSSVMFDFALTGRPMLFYAYDLERYRDDLRGFYFDFESDAPGPLLSSTAAVADALQDLDALADQYADAHARFRARFCHRDDGRASARVVDALLGPRATGHGPAAVGSKRAPLPAS